MRKWLVVLMLFLLPLRGLVGDAMAYSMLPAALTVAQTVQQKATNLVAAPEVFGWAAASFAHTNKVQATAASPCHIAMADADSNDSMQNQCTSCQACHLSAATSLQLPSDLLQTATALPEQRQALWHSAEPRWIAKTPIL